MQLRPVGLEGGLLLESERGLLWLLGHEGNLQRMRGLRLWLLRLEGNRQRVPETRMFRTNAVVVVRLNWRMVNIEDCDYF